MNAFKTIACAVAVTLSLATAALAGGDLSPADNKALHDYTLSMNKITAMGAALDDFNKSAGVLSHAKAIGDTSKSIAEMIAKTNADGQLMAIYRAHGLAANDAVLMPFVLMYSGMAVAYPSAAPKLAESTSPAQIAFYKQHQKELKSIKWLSGQ